MDHSQTIADYTETFLKALGFDEELQVAVNYSSDDDLYSVVLTTEKPAVLIGFHGDNLAAMQALMSQHLFSSVGEWLNLSLNVNDYRERREAALQAMADAAVDKVVASGQAYTLPPLPANERRVIHVYLSEHAQVSTESVGEGRQRSVMVTPRSQ
jgi:spoIIIJ-associated protein